MASLTDELPLNERLKFKQAAYDKFTNLQPAQEKQNIAANTQLENTGMRNVYKGIMQGGYAGSQVSDKALDQTQLELAQSRGKQNAAEDALSVQGAGMKEDIIGARQKESLGAFNRQTQEMEDAMDKAVAERAFDLGMTAKELAFHTNSKVADIGLERMKEDYNAGNTSKLELQTVADNLQKAALEAKMEADKLLGDLKRQGDMEATKESRALMLKLSLAMLEKQKAATKAAAKASNIANIITGTATMAGAAIGFAYGGGPVGGSVGASVGSGVGSAVSGGLANSSLGSSIYGQ